MKNEKLLQSVKQQYENFPYSYEKFLSHSLTNENLVEELNSYDANIILDVGCGVNPFKGKVKNLIGLDVADYPAADLIAPIEKAKDFFLEGSIDVIVALGSINFGTFDNIITQLGIMIDLVKPGGTLILRGRGKNRRSIVRNERAFIHHQWTLDDVYQVTEIYKDKIKLVHDPLHETAAAGKIGSPGQADKEAKMDLWVWRWKKL